LWYDPAELALIPLHPTPLEIVDTLESIKQWYAHCSVRLL
jgi:hypothetical protein